MILVTRLNGSPFAVNPDLLERVEPTPDTVLTLIDGTKYIVTESVTEVISLVREFRASVVVAARAVPREGLDEAAGDTHPAPVATRTGHAHPHLHVAPEPADEAADDEPTGEPEQAPVFEPLAVAEVAAVTADASDPAGHHAHAGGAGPVTVGG